MAENHKLPSAADEREVGSLEKTEIERERLDQLRLIVLLVILLFTSFSCLATFPFVTLVGFLAFSLMTVMGLYAFPLISFAIRLHDTSLSFSMIEIPAYAGARPMSGCPRRASRLTKLNPMIRSDSRSLTRT